jgi:aspartyl/glutamyl-tRNA(Asn/Gln) amidotransferase C subunit
MISKEDIEGLANLARLKLKDGEAEALGKDISSILGYVGQISAASAEGTSDSLQDDRGRSSKVPPALRNVMREDAPRAEGDPVAGKEEAVRAQFPRREGNYNVVRKIIQKDE